MIIIAATMIVHPQELQTHVGYLAPNYPSHCGPAETPLKDYTPENPTF